MSVANWIKSIVLCCNLDGHAWVRTGYKRFCSRCGCEEWIFHRRNPMIEEPSFYWRRMPKYLWEGNRKRISASKEGCMSAVGDNMHDVPEMTGGKDPRPERADSFQKVEKCHDRICPQNIKVSHGEPERKNDNI